MEREVEILPVNKGLRGFQETPIKHAEKAFAEKPCSYFLQQGERMAFNLFHQMAERVPAYKDFLQKHSIDKAKITTPKDLSHVPWMDKNNYIKEYPLNARCWGGELNGSIISSSSGSSGKPTFWPRSEAIETETSYVFELFLKNIFEIDKYKTLYISALGMGIYVGGTFTLNCCMRIAEKGYPLTIVTPGINKKEFIETYEALSDDFDQVIFSGYPPLIKDILDEMGQNGLNTSKKRIRFHFSAESISEEFRNYLYNRISADDNHYLQNSMNLYGTADAGIAGHETPLAIRARRLLSDNNDYTFKRFHTTTVPSINVYYPFFKHFETTEHQELILSTPHNTTPLLRYNIHDQGGILSTNEMLQMIDDLSTHKTMILHKVPSWNLPYVFLHGKTDHSVKLSGAIIYADSVKKALEKAPLYSFVTGKFTMQSKVDDKGDQFLQVHVELKKNCSAHQEHAELASKIIRETLLKDNAEFRAINNDKFHKPHVCFWPYEHETYFSPGLKQKWAVKA